MSLPLRFSREAEYELVEASRWYDSRRAGLGLEFVPSIEASLRRIDRNPRAGALIPSVEDKAVRRFPVRRFPYHIVYVELSDRLQVLAVAHDRRRPGYWVDRGSG